MSTQQRRSDRRISPRQLLVASPHAQGTPHERQVVLLLKHSPRGSIGVALNEHSQEPVREMRGRKVNPLQQRRAETKQRIAVPVGVIQWGPGQLDKELSHGVWLMSSAKLDDAVGARNDLWVDLVRHVGRTVLRDALSIQHMPSDPTVN